MKHATLASPRSRALATDLCRLAWQEPRAALRRAHERLRRERWVGARERRAMLDAAAAAVRRPALVRLLVAQAGEGALLEVCLALAGLAPPSWDPAALEAELGRRSPVERRALVSGLPGWLCERLAGDPRLAATEAEADRLLDALNQRAPLTLRANRARIDAAALAARLSREGVPARPGRWARDALVLEGHPNVEALAAYRDGSLEVQDEGSQLIAELAVPPPGGVVLDVCAGAGGKSLALAAAGARVVASDIAAARLDELRRRAGRAGARVAVTDPAGLGAHAGADRVLLDVPCSGTGTLRREPDLRHRLDAAAAAAFPPRQRALLDQHARLCRPGGLVVYATCSLLGDENEAVVDAFLGAHRDFELVPAGEILGPRAAELGGDVLRLAPHRHGTDGFFAAALRRRS